MLWRILFFALILPLHLHAGVDWVGDSVFIGMDAEQKRQYHLDEQRRRVSTCSDLTAMLVTNSNGREIANSFIKYLTDTHAGVPVAQVEKMIDALISLERDESFLSNPSLYLQVKSDDLSAEGQAKAEVVSRVDLVLVAYLHHLKTRGVLDRLAQTFRFHKSEGQTTVWSWNPRSSQNPGP